MTQHAVRDAQKHTHLFVPETEYTEAHRQDLAGLLARNMRKIREYRRLSAATISVGMGLQPYVIEDFENTANYQNLERHARKGIYDFAQQFAELVLVPSYMPMSGVLDSLSTESPEYTDVLDYAMDFYRDRYAYRDNGLTGRETFLEVEETAWREFQAAKRKSDKPVTLAAYQEIARHAGLAEMPYLRGADIPEAADPDRLAELRKEEMEKTRDRIMD